MTMADVWICYEAHVQERVEQTKIQWQIGRIICYYAAHPDADPKKYPNSPERLFALAWEKDNISKRKTAREILDEHNRRRENKN